MKTVSSGHKNIAGLLRATPGTTAAEWLPV